MLTRRLDYVTARPDEPIDDTRLPALPRDGFPVRDLALRGVESPVSYVPVEAGCPRAWSLSHRAQAVVWALQHAFAPPLRDEG
jgi:hypothetical protein